MHEPFELQVEDVFHITGRGYVVTGRIGLGRVRVGDRLVAKTAGGEQPCTVTSINVGKDLVDEAGAGTDAALMLRGFDPKKLQDASGVPLWHGGARAELVLRDAAAAQDAGAAAPKVGSIEESIARLRGKERPWWKFW
jgi:GTPase